MDSTPQTLKEQLNCTDLLSVLNEHLANHGLVILQRGNSFSVVNKTEKAYVELSKHDTLPNAYACALDTLVEGAIWEAQHGKGLS